MAKTRQEKQTPLKRFFRRLEYIVDKTIPYLIVIIFAILLIETFSKESFEKYVTIFDISYFIIMGFFILDLIFKYLRVRNMKQFVKHYWLDIIAVFPFYLIFRIFEEISAFFRVSQTVRDSQLVLHEGIELERVMAAESRIIRGAEAGAKEAGFMQRMLRVILRSPRLLKARVFFKHPKKHK